MRAFDSVDSNLTRDAGDSVGGVMEANGGLWYGVPSKRGVKVIKEWEDETRCDLWLEGAGLRDRGY